MEIAEQKVYEIAFPHLGITIEHLNRVCFKLFGLPIYWYGVIIVSGILLAVYVGLRRAKASGQSEDFYLDYMLYNTLIVIFGARLYYVIFSWDYYKQNPMKIFAFRDGGLAIYGAVLTAALTVFIYTKIKKYNFFLFADTAVPSLILGQAIGRFGNFFNREAFGGYTDSLFAMQYLKTTVDQALPQGVIDNIITIAGHDYIQVHPTFLYESVLNFSIFFFLLWYDKRKKFTGELMFFYFIFYGVGRFFIEGMRVDQLKLWNTNLAVSQILSLILIGISVFACFYYRKRGKIYG